MGTVQKVLMGLIIVGGAVALTLPDRQTVPVINAGTSFFRGSLATAMGTGKKI